VKSGGTNLHVYACRRTVAYFKPGKREKFSVRYHQPTGTHDRLIRVQRVPQVRWLC